MPHWMTIVVALFVVGLAGACATLGFLLALATMRDLRDWEGR